MDFTFEIFGICIPQSNSWSF